eukprot:TRINITY_DN4738_c0_g1_i1.p4 TRINITY_DN4738_c0_g1~~TRINITY_DN4738_c0_g1_i1.p4  ORF type:complete len:119 (-),score=17.91 TRINITY_DN4738_c0_g1_i1:389-745(-)
MTPLVSCHQTQTPKLKTLPVASTANRRQLLNLGFVLPLSFALKASAMDRDDANRRRAERRQQLREAAQVASTSGTAVELDSMDSDYSMPDDHSPNVHGRKSRTVPGKEDHEKIRAVVG